MDVVRFFHSLGFINGLDFSRGVMFQSPLLVWEADTSAYTLRYAVLSRLLEGFYFWKGNKGSITGSTAGVRVLPPVVPESFRDSVFSLALHRSQSHLYVEFTRARRTEAASPSRYVLLDSPLHCSLPTHHNSGDNRPSSPPLCSL